MEDVVAAATPHLVVAVLSENEIVPFATVDVVIACATLYLVIARAAVDGVIAQTTVQRVVAVAAIERVVAIAPNEVVIAIRASVGGFLCDCACDEVKRADSAVGRNDLQLDLFTSLKSGCLATSIVEVEGLGHEIPGRVEGLRLRGKVCRIADILKDHFLAHPVGGKGRRGDVTQVVGNNLSRPSLCQRDHKPGVAFQRIGRTVFKGQP